MSRRETTPGPGDWSRPRAAAAAMIDFRPRGDDSLWTTAAGEPTAVLDLTLVAAAEAAQHWPSVLPGVLDASGGFRSHRLELVFVLGAGSGAVLRLDLVAERGPCPDIELVLDSHRGVFHPRIERDDRSSTGEPGPVSGIARLEVALPPQWLGPGRHVLTLATVLDEAALLDDPVGTTGVRRRLDESLPPARSHYGRWFGSYLRLRRVRLTPLTVPPVPQSPTGTVTATPFFVRTEAGERELIDVDLDWQAGSPVPGEITVTVAGHRVNLPSMPTDRDFGTVRRRVRSPVELNGPTPVHISGPGIDLSTTIEPCRRWTLHLVPHIHLDLGFTDAQGKVLELHCRNIDRALDLMDADPSFRFSVDGAFVVQEYRSTRSPAQVDRLFAAIRGGTLGVNALHSNQLTGVMSLDELVHALDASADLPVSRVTGLRYANLTDVPTATRVLPSVLRAAGIDAFVGMANHHRAATGSSDVLHLASPVRWEGPDGAQVLAYVADHYSQLRFIVGDPQAVSGAIDGLGRLLARYERADYLPTDLPVIGSHADNEDLAEGDTSLVARWNDVFAYPRMRVSTFDEYLAAVAPLTDRLPVWRVDQGTFWEDGVGSATAAFAVHRRAQALLPAVETIGAAIALADPRLRVDRAELDRAWRGMAIATEHTLTWARSTTHPHAAPVADQLGWKTRFIDDAYRVAVDESRRQLAQLAELADCVGPGILVVNPHPWPARLEAEVDLLVGVDLLGPDGPLPTETLSSCAGMRRVRVVLPSMDGYGYAYYPASEGLDTAPDGGERPDAGTVARVTASSVAGPDVGGDPAGVHAPARAVATAGVWQVTLDPTTSLIRGLRHRPSGHELLDLDSPWGLGELVRLGHPDAEADAGPVTAGRWPREHQHERHVLAALDARALPGDDDSRHDAEADVQTPHLSFEGAAATPDGTRLRWSGVGAHLRAVRLDVLLRDEGPIDVTVAFDKQECLDMEVLSVAFPFAAPEMLTYDKQLGRVRPDVDHGPGAGNEWFALTHAARLVYRDATLVWVPLDAPLFSIGDVVRGTWPDRFTKQSGRLFSYAMNNAWPCNTPPAQAGAVNLTYRIAWIPTVDEASAAVTARIARLDALAAEITPLDRFAAGRPSRPRVGRLLELRLDPRTDLRLRQGVDGDVDVTHINLCAQAVPAVPGRSDGAGPTSITTMPALAGFGFAAGEPLHAASPTDHLMEPS
ncbi:MAG: hypothetical protein ACOH17_01100 [Cellulomonas sp.]